MTTRDTHVDAEIGELLDGSLPVDDADRVRTHIASCLACRRVHDELRDAIADVRVLPSYELPAGVWAGIERELDTRKRRNWPRIAAVAAIVAGGALGASAALGTYRSSWSRRPAKCFDCCSRRSPSR